MKRQSFNDSGYAHYLTFSCYHRRQLLTDDHVRQWLADAINAARLKLHFRLWAWVFMPEHVHLLVWPTEDSCSVAKILQAIKGPCARHVLAAWRSERSDRLSRTIVTSTDGVKHRFWQAGGGFDRNVRGMEMVPKAVEYIEYNPVRRGLVSVPSEWRWSSAGHGNPLTTDPIGFERES